MALDACKDYCLVTPECKGFTFSEGRCWPHSDVAEGLNEELGGSLFTLLAPPASEKWLGWRRVAIVLAGHHYKTAALDIKEYAHKDVWKDMAVSASELGTIGPCATHGPAGRPCSGKECCDFRFGVINSSRLGRKVKSPRCCDSGFLQCYTHEDDVQICAPRGSTDYRASLGAMREHLLGVLDRRQIIYDVYLHTYPSPLSSQFILDMGPIASTVDTQGSLKGKRNAHYSRIQALKLVQSRADQGVHYDAIILTRPDLNLTQDLDKLPIDPSKINLPFREYTRHKKSLRGTAD